MTSEAGGPALQAVRVLEICDEKGSYCGKLFADMGAEVIKLEPPGTSLAADSSGRAIPPFMHGQADVEHSLHFLYNNTNKKSITLDISSGAGRQQVLELVRSCDVLIESLPPGKMDECGLCVETLLAENRGLVVTSISGFGQSGPHRDYKTADIVASALGGVMVATGFPDDPPVKLVGSQSYVMASTMAAVSSMIALRHSRETGEGQQVDISIQETMLAVTSICGVGKWLEDDIESRRFGTGLFASVPSGSYPCKDGGIYLMVNRPLHWQALAKWVNEVSGNMEILDPMFEGPSSARQPYRELLDIFISELTMQYTAEEFYREGQRRHLAVTPLSTGHGIARDHHLNERQFYVDVEQRDKTVLRYPGPPYRFSLTPWAIRSPAPEVGQHNSEFAKTPADGPGFTRPEISNPPGERKAAGKGALAGLRVIEFTTGMAGPWIGRMMACCGADVIRVESKGYPDVSRLYVSPKSPEEGVQSQGSPWLTDWNAGKRCVSLDLTDARATGLARRLIAESDVVIDNNGNGVLEKLGLDFAGLKDIKPGLILLSSTGYGKHGPDASYISWGPNIEALSGLAALSGFPHRDCTMTQFAYPDPLAALYGLFAIMCAVEHRQNTGLGQQINISQLEATVASMGHILLQVFADDREPEKLGNSSLQHVPQGCYRCLDESGNNDRWCTISVANEREWHDFCQLLEAPDWLDDPRFNTFESRLSNQRELDMLISQWTSVRDPHEVMHALQMAGIAAGVVQGAEDQWLRDPQLRARQYFETIRHEKKGSVVASGLALGLLGTPGKTPHAGRAIGADNHAVFCQLLGLEEAEFQQYLEAGVIQA